MLPWWFRQRKERYKRKFWSKIQNIISYYATPHPRRGGCTGAGGPRGATPRSSSGGVTVRTCPSANVKEQCLRFAGAAVKRYPMSKVRETQVRWQVFQEESDGRHKNHNHIKIVNLITRTTALSNSMKLSHALWGHPRWAGHGGEVRQNLVHWRREWQTTSIFLP